jgi:hypothetical protein
MISSERKIIDLTKLFFDALESSRLTFDYERMLLPAGLYKNKPIIAKTIALRTHWIGTNFKSTPGGQLQKHILFNQMIKELVNECNERFDGGVIAIHQVYVYTYVHALEEDFTQCGENRIYFRYAICEPTIAEKEYYRQTA